MLAEKTKRMLQVAERKLGSGFGWEMGAPFESFLSLSVQLRLTRNELKFWAWLRMEESEKEEQRVDGSDFSDV